MWVWAFCGRIRHQATLHVFGLEVEVSGSASRPICAAPIAELGFSKPARGGLAKGSLSSWEQNLFR